ncbi:Ig-like domain-containing protein [Leptospira sp. 'Mane']|uniref:Ig-like domain-containing protein n=1 Tax=Leptospira sp. 'Mane' TaxID=3387407 RepID=UPI00398B0D5E
MITKSNIVFISLFLYQLIFVQCSFLLDGEKNPLNLPTTGLALLEDTSPPKVTSSWPPQDHVGIPTNAEIVISFSKEMNESFTESAFSLTNAGARLEGTFKWIWNTMYFSPKLALNKPGQYIYSLQKVRAESKKGINLLDDFRVGFNFNSDSEQPTLVGTIPASGAISVTPNASVTVEFSEPMDVSTVLPAITISPSVSFNLPATVISNDDKTFQFFPKQSLNYGITYTISIPNTIKDKVGNLLVQNYSTTFTVGSDFERPKPVSVSTTAVPNFLNREYILTNGFEKDEAFIIQFSKQVQPATVLSAVSFNPSFDFSVADVDGNNTTYRISPNSNLEISQTYQMMISASIRDFQNNTLDKEYVFFPKINGPKSKFIQIRGIFGNAYNTVTANDFGNIMRLDRINESIPPLNACVAATECDQNLFINFCWGDNSASCIYPLIAASPPYGTVILSSLDVSVSREFAGSIVGPNAEYLTTFSNVTPVYPFDIFAYSTTARFLDRDSIYKLTIRGGKSGVTDNFGNYMKEDYSIRIKFP